VEFIFSLAGTKLGRNGVKRENNPVERKMAWVFIFPSFSTTWYSLLHQFFLKWWHNIFTESSPCCFAHELYSARGICLTNFCTEIMTYEYGLSHVIFMTCGSRNMQNIYGSIYGWYWTHFVGFVIYITMVQTGCDLDKRFRSYSLPKILNPNKLASHVVRAVSIRSDACTL
jgi:hypothetical protein